MFKQGPKTMQQLPLLFDFSQVVMGKGFIANVSMCGRALLEEDSDEVWITGIAPVGFSNGGNSRGEAYVEFKKSWIAILFDIASETASFKEFQTKCEEFLNADMPHTTKMWETALDEVRKQGYTDEKLRTQSADEKEVRYSVRQLSSDEFVPAFNLLESTEGSEAGYKKAS